jgi:tetratricopeptide (TPR) repeat protein
MERIYVHHDRLLGRYVELAGEDATILLLSDHGFHGDSLRPPGSARVQDEPVSWHRDFGIFAAAGPGLRCDERVHGMTLLDVAPTVLALLGLPVARDMDGKVQTQIWQDPPTLEWVDSHEDGSDGERKPLVAADLAASAVVLEQLAALGYLDAGSLEGAAAVRQARVSQLGTLARIHRSIGAHRDAEAACREQLAAIEAGMEDSGAAERAQAVRLELAAVLAECGEHGEAESLIDALAAQGADRGAIERLRGRLLLTQADPAAAARHYEGALAHAPNDPQARFGLALCQLRLESWAAAEATLRALIARDPEADRAIHLLGIACYHQHRYEDALTAQMQAVSLRHVNPRAHYYLGLSAAQLGRLEWARRAFEVAIELRPAFAAARNALSTLDRRIGGRFRPDTVALSTPAVHSKRETPPARPRAAAPIRALDDHSPVLVSGLPRSGTSLMMQMLAAGGLPALTDGARAADPDNPRGYLEWEPVRRIAEHPQALVGARGRALKVVSALLPALPREGCRVLFMERDLREIRDSQTAMLRRRSSTAPIAGVEELGRHLTEVRAWLARQPHLDVCFVSHAELMRRPAAVAAQLRDFLRLDLDIGAMAAVVEPALHRQRAPRATGS